MALAPPIRVIPLRVSADENALMSNASLSSISDQLADIAAAAAPSIVQVHGARRPATGVVHGPDTLVTTARAIGREDGLRVLLPDDTALEADLAGWDPATGIAVLRARRALGVPPPAIAEQEPRTGHLVVALARSWSNALTASAGNVAVVGGPLHTGRRRAIPRVIRVTAAMHDGFAGGGLFDASGRLAGIATATAIRGFGVAIPVSIAWAAAAQVLTSGTPRRGFVGVAVQPVELPAAQRGAGRERGLLVVGVTTSSPAETAGLLVGDILIEFDGRATESPEDLLDALTERLVGRTVPARVLRGAEIREVHIAVAERTRR